MTSQHWRGFIVCQLLGLGLLASWLFPPTRALWDAIDKTVFYALNGTLNPAPSLWGEFWALLSFRPVDLLPMCLLLPFLLIPDLVIPRSQRATACIHIAFVLFVMLVVRWLVNEITDELNWRGYSPSRTLQPVYLISQLYPYLHPKDSSNSSFPGDHAAVLMIVASFLLLHRFRHWSALAIGAILLLFLMPRMIAGAHWFTDVVVGGTLIATQSLAYGFFTPWPKQWAEKLANRWVSQRWH